jgi:hypothetical protein
MSLLLLLRRRRGALVAAILGYLLASNGNYLTDHAGNRLTWS